MEIQKGNCRKGVTSQLKKVVFVVDNRSTLAISTGKKGELLKRETTPQGRKNCECSAKPCVIREPDASISVSEGSLESANVNRG